MAVGGYFSDVVEEGEGAERNAVDPDELDDVEFDTAEIPLRGGEAAGPQLQEYFRALERATRDAYDFAEACRRKGLDPEVFVEIPRAEDLAARVEALVGPRGVAQRIRELSKERGREEVSLLVAKEVAAGKFGAFPTRDAALDAAIRTGLAILTEGILVAPLEGIAGVRIVRNDDGTDGVSVSFAGPIRAAGGTGQALSVLIADVVRRELGIGRYRPIQAEIDRLKEEIPAYKNAQHLQYTPTAEEIDLIVRGCPIMIDGEGTEDTEITGNRDLSRIETNRLRGGACLVIAEGLTLKAPKVQKHVQKLKLAGWEFLDEFLARGKSASKADEGGAPKTGLEPNPKYLAELVAGRPVFGYPSRKGGFRLHYGRARTGGLASTAVHPAAMVILDNFLAVGTQMKIERPGKATVATPCDEIEPPIALLHNGSLVEVTTIAQADALKTKVRRIIDLGEILVPFGEFAENNKPLPQAAYAPEWWAQEAALALGALEPPARAAASALLRPESATALESMGLWLAAGTPLPGAAAAAPARARGRPPMGWPLIEAFHIAEDAARFAETTGTPLHPRFNLFYHDVTGADLEALSRIVEEEGRWVAPNSGREGGAITLPKSAPSLERAKAILVELGAIFDIVDDGLVVGRHSYTLLRSLGLDVRGGKIARVREVDSMEAKGVDAASRAAGFRIRARGAVRIGTRMARPEKAAERKMEPPVHVLFPLGQAGGMQRLVREAAASAKPAKDGAEPTIEIEVGLRQCPECRRITILARCDRDGCGAHTEPVPVERIEPSKIALPDLLARAQARIEMDRLPETVKGVIGLVSAKKTPEPLEKGLLRAKHEVYTFKDGTIRFDMTDVPLTHFKPSEAHVSVARLRDLGYVQDIDGAPLERDDQILELKPQDVLIAYSGMDYLLKAARFVDDELGRFYGVKPFYGVKTRDDLIGQLLVGLAPHTSGGVLARLVGWTQASVGFAHPYFHAAKRRNCVRGDMELVLIEPNPAAIAPGVAVGQGTAAPTQGLVAVSTTGNAATALASTVAVAARERPVRRAIGPWVEKLLAEHVDKARFIDAYGTEKLDLEAAGIRCEAITLDPVTRRPRRVPVTSVLRGKTKAWIRVRTAGGRKFVCTPDHNVMIAEAGQWHVKPAEKMEVGDLVPISSALPADVGAGWQPKGKRPTARGNEWYGLDVVERVDWVESEGPTYCIDVETGSRDLTTKNVLWGSGLFQIRCDGDEDCVMLLLDGLLNFSRSYLPQSRGGQMDAPLTLTLRIDPNEVDKEAHNVDASWLYPIAFYEATANHPAAKEVEPMMDTVSKRLGKPDQYEGLGFTHDTADVGAGPAASSYKTIGDMLAKMEAQLELGARIRAVDASDVAARVIGSHFLPDLRGNLVAFSKQKMRCTKCNAKYRRVPLQGVCLKCGNSLTMTVHEGSVRKYLIVSKEICERYNVDRYTRHRIEHIEDSIESVFTNDRVKKAKLSDFF
ncbi:MAG: DNA polymerase II large subunit [Thermoplasmatota archaeon]